MVFKDDIGAICKLVDIDEFVEIVDVNMVHMVDRQAMREYQEIHGGSVDLLVDPHRFRKLRPLYQVRNLKTGLTINVTKKELEAIPKSQQQTLRILYCSEAQNGPSESFEGPDLLVDPSYRSLRR